RRSLVELDAHPTGSGALGALDVCVEVAPMAGEPLALVDETRILRGNRGFEARGLGVEHELFQGAVGRVEDDRRGGFIDFARFDPHKAVLDHVDPADPMEAAKPIQLVDQGDPPTLPSPRGGGICGESCGMPRSKLSSISAELAGALSTDEVHTNASSGGLRRASSRIPASMERPHRFSSTLYGDSGLTSMGSLLALA